MKYSNPAGRSLSLEYGKATERYGARSLIREANVSWNGDRWFYVFKNGLKLSYGRNIDAAKEHADNCGGQVMGWNKEKKTMETLYVSSGETK